MRVEIHLDRTGEERLLWQGLVDHIPRVGETVVLYTGPATNPTSEENYTVQHVFYMLPTGNAVTKFAMVRVR
jgi:hypothetical protein